MVAIRANFSQGIDWRPFFESYGATFQGEPNKRGWAQFPCVLPTHPQNEKAKSLAAIHVGRGLFKCWSGRCRARYLDRVRKEHSECLTPREFLIVCEAVPTEDAERVVESFRQADPKKFHCEEFSTHYAPSPDLAEFVARAQSRLRPDLDIVVEYCSSRHLDYATLVEVGAGYIPETENQEECLILPYTIDGLVVGVRGRTIDGRKGGVKDSYHTLYRIDDLRPDNVSVIVLVEGESDTLYMRQLLKRRGFKNATVLGTPGASFRSEWVRHVVHADRIIAIPHDDDAGVRWKNEITKRLQSLVDVVHLPWSLKSQGKDVVDFCRNGPEYQDQLIDLLALHQIPERRAFVMSAPDLLREAQKPIPWLVPYVVERGTKTLIVGPPKTYKTWLILNLARSITQRMPFLDIDEWTPASNGKVLLVEEEGSRQRLGKRMIEIGLISEDLYVIHKRGMRLDEDESFEQLRRTVMRLQPDAVILDPYASLHSQDENTVSGTMVVVNALDRIQRILPDCALVLVHHSAKGQTRAPRGSGALWGAMDNLIVISRQKTPENRIRLQMEGRDLTDEFPSEMEFDFMEGNFRPLGEFRLHLKT